jgi:hypothetical protein
MEIKHAHTYWHVHPHLVHPAKFNHPPNHSLIPFFVKKHTKFNWFTMWYVGHVEWVSLRALLPSFLMLHWRVKQLTLYVSILFIH